MALPGHHLWAQVACGANEGRELSRLCQVILGEPKVSEPDVTSIIEQTIFRFEIAVKNLLRVKVLETQEDLTEVEARIRLLETAPLEHVEEQLSATTEIQHKKKVGACLESPVEGHDERVSEPSKNTLLCDHPLQPLLLLEKPCLAHDLHCTHAARGLVQGLNHATRASDPNDADNIEILDTPVGTRLCPSVRSLLGPVHHFEHSLEGITIAERGFDRLTVIKHESVVGTKRFHCKGCHERRAHILRQSLLLSGGEPLTSAQTWTTRQQFVQGRRRDNRLWRWFPRRKHLQPDHWRRLWPLPLESLDGTAQQPTRRRSRHHVEQKVVFRVHTILCLETSNHTHRCGFPWMIWSQQRRSA
mmetsp:Transcript_49789/g.132043  ORF Transcript_49789/g.132043 Transcript_49789/m.132043 type:complete len:359 (+) Transcript_49789:528-1604(+)